MRSFTVNATLRWKKNVNRDVRQCEEKPIRGLVKPTVTRQWTSATSTPDPHRFEPHQHPIPTTIDQIPITSCPFHIFSSNSETWQANSTKLGWGRYSGDWDGVGGDGDDGIGDWQVGTKCWEYGWRRVDVNSSPEVMCRVCSNMTDEEATVIACASLAFSALSVHIIKVDSKYNCKHKSISLADKNARSL